MIQIHGLTERQHQIMTTLWQCATIQDVNAVIKALPNERDRQDAQSLVKIATWETLEQQGALDEYEELAHSAIEHARNWLC